MKRYACIVLLLAFFSGIFPQNAATASTMNWQDLYREYIKDHYRQAFSEETATSMFLIDLDLDGVPELLGGSDSMTYSPITVAITIRDGKITKLKQNGEGISGDKDRTGFALGVFALFGIDLYKNKNTGAFIPY